MKSAPQNLEAERSVLGGLLNEPTALDEVRSVSLGEADFYAPAHAQIFSAMLALDAAARPIDIVELSDMLRNRGQLERVGGADALMALSGEIPVVAHIVAHAKSVRAAAAKRRVATAATRILAELESGVEDTADFLDRTGRAVLSACELSNNEGDARHISDVVIEVIDELQRRADAGGELVGYTTGLQLLDRMISGLCPGNLIVVAARPGMGKSALVQEFLRAVPARHKLPSLAFSLEMPAAQWGQRLLASTSSVDGQKVRGAEKMLRDDWTEITKSAGALAQLPIWIDDTPGLTIHEIRRRARRLCTRSGKLGLIGVDYMQLARGANGDNREQQIAEISRELKSLAKELECPVVALSQLSRAVEARADHRPLLSDLRESGAIEQDADTVIFIYRDEVYHADSKDRGVAELIIGKQRSGPTGMIRVAFDKRYTRFRDIEPARQERTYAD